jgi:hypothetical protein
LNAPDLLVNNEGTIFCFTPLTRKAKLWFRENVETEHWQWLCATCVVEHGFALGLAVGIKDAGLELR